MINHYRISLLASGLVQEAARASAYEQSNNDLMANISSESALEDFKKIAHEFGYSIEKIAAPKLRAAA